MNFVELLGIRLFCGRLGARAATQRRFKLTFTLKHGSWLNLGKGVFFKLTRSDLRQIRVSSKQEFRERIVAAIGHFNHDPIVHSWTYKIDKAA
jgi:hypothetical protein